MPARGDRARPARTGLPGPQPGRTDRNFGPHVIRNQKSQLRRSFRGLRKEGFRHIFVLETPEEVEAATVERCRSGTIGATSTGRSTSSATSTVAVKSSKNCWSDSGMRVAAYAGDAALGGGPFSPPRGPQGCLPGRSGGSRTRILDTVRLVRNMVGGLGPLRARQPRHEARRKLRGKNVQITHGLADTLAEIDAMPDVIRADRSPTRWRSFLDGLVSHYVLDDGKLVVAHAGMKEEMQGRGSGKVRDFALYGETTGETDEFGLPVRYKWAKEYRGPAMVVYGHTPVPEPEWLNRTVNIDTGCVFGGKLTALRYPEKEFVSVPAARTYCEPARPFLPPNSRLPPCRRSRPTIGCSTPRTCWASGSSRPGFVATSRSVRRTPRRRSR